MPHSHFQALGTPITSKEADALPKDSGKVGSATVAAIITAFVPNQKESSAAPPPQMVGRATVKAIIDSFTPKKQK